MNLTQERINEIAKECSQETFDAIEFANLFLSRIREEQEPYGYRIENHVAITFTRNKETYESCGGFPLFTIPPAAPDCSKLVEALEKIAGDGNGHAQYRMWDTARQALANHAKRMNGEE